MDDSAVERRNREKAVIVATADWYESILNEAHNYVIIGNKHRLIGAIAHLYEMDFPRE